MRSLLNRSTAEGVSSLGHDLGVSFSFRITRLSTASLAHLRSSHALSTRPRSNLPLKVSVFVPMTSSARTLRGPDRAFSTRGVTFRRDFSSTPAYFADKTHPNVSAEIPSQDSSSPKPEHSTLHKCGSAATEGDPAKPSKNEPYTPPEVCAILVLLLSYSTTGAKSISITEALHQLPTEMQEMVRKHSGGLMGYVQEHLSESFRVSTDGMALLPVPASPQLQRSDAPPIASDAVKRKVSLSPPPPPRPSAPLAAAPDPFLKFASTPTAAREELSSNPLTDGAAPTRRLRTNIEVLDALVEYIPTFFVFIEAIDSTLPPEIRALYTGTSLIFFLRRFKHYLDVKSAFGRTKIRLKEDFLHPKRGMADVLYMTGEEAAQVVESRRRPPRNSEANLLLSLLPRVPKEPKPFAEVLQDISDIVSRHPAFDLRLGVMGFLEKYPEYFQVAEGRLRVRPYHVAPNALDELNVESSPFPETFAKLMPLINSMAEGKPYHDDNDRAAASVPTGKLYSMLTNEERNNIRAACRSFPRFLRLHGRAIMVSLDNMRVCKFKPEYERCAETLLSTHASGMEVSPDDPVLHIPAMMDEHTNADWVFRELYNALPLMQCAELEDILVLVPDAVKEALPQSVDELALMLSKFPDYFDTWPYPDDPSVIIIQRAKVSIPVYEKEEIIKRVLPLIPQGGIKLSALRSRVPLPLQRYFYRYGVSKTLGEMDQVFCISDGCIIRIQ